MRNLPQHILRLPRNAIVLMIAAYQKTLSPDHGPLRHLYPYGYCRHEPTCSAFGKKVVSERGVIIGVPLMLWRIARCNPWTKPDEKKLRKLAEKIY